ncbi:hypothetical protein QQF64_026193 [Cirrhinus molitorella]|uniref:DDE Tnp4 domain-containing protein n=1 Tax=Cirrhinus molitorella TaxID=172907 RepID=A0ABR3NSJ4_9TELE
MTLPNGEHLGQYHLFFVGDEAFPLQKHLLRPYPERAIPVDQRVFNFRLSHARRIVENAFGIMAAQFRVYHRVIELSPSNAEKIVQATTILHNFMRWGHQNSPSTTGCADPGAALNAAGRMGSNTASREAMAMREKYKVYFNKSSLAVQPGYVSLARDSADTFVQVLRYTGSAQSFMLEDVLPFSDVSYTGANVIVRGIKMGYISVPLHTVNLKTDLFTGLVQLGVCKKLAVDNVSLILGNDLACVVSDCVPVDGDLVLAEPQTPGVRLNNCAMLTPIQSEHCKMGDHED